ncbi:MAG: LCP family protein, partial [Elusimicrobiota bacterium]|nr:LCP family protein [Elusimicrobiota bacterium]
IKNNKNIIFLIVGTDYVDYSYHSDTIILFSYNPYNRFLDVISIPRDTKVTLPDINLNRINEFYAYYYRREKTHHSALQAISKIVNTIFYNRIEVPYYIQLNYALFKKFIDALNGIEIEIEEEMHYEDKAGKLSIHLSAGRHHLNGEKALQYVRFRSSAGDIGRIYRQQRFIKALFNKIRKPSLVLYLPNLFKLAATHQLNTNFTLYDILTLISELKNINLDNVRLSQLPGRYYYHYWLPDEGEIDGMLNKIYGPETEFDLSKNRITIEVCNASSIQNAALEVTRKLRKVGFDVIEYKNYPTKQIKTIVIDRVGNLKASQCIAKLLSTNEVFTRYDSKRLVDISVIIGEEYKSTSEGETLKKWQK